METNSAWKARYVVQCVCRGIARSWTMVRIPATALSLQIPNISAESLPRLTEPLITPLSLVWSFLQQANDEISLRSPNFDGKSKSELVHTSVSVWICAWVFMLCPRTRDMGEKELCSLKTAQSLFTTNSSSLIWSSDSKLTFKRVTLF